MKERVLISGSSGFIGSQLRRRLSEKYQIQRLDRLELNEPKEIIFAFNPDIIFHLAAYGNYHYQQDIKEIYQTNVIKLLYLLEASDKINYRAFINVGSSSEYGRKQKPMKETDRLDPETFYAASKAAGTLLTKVWATQRNKPIITIRPFSIIGIGEQEHHLIPTLIRSCFEGEKAKFVPYFVHDFIDIDDVIDGMLLLIKYADKYKSSVFNIGSGKQYTNQEVRETVEKVTGKRANIAVVEELRGYDTNIWVADTTSLRILNNPTLRSLGWEPKKNLEQIVKGMVEHYEQRTTKAGTPD